MKRRVSKLGAAPVTYGLPETIVDLHKLSGLAFQRWVIGRTGAEPSPTDTGDMGIDGYSFFNGYPIQVKKSEGVGRNVVDNFETAIERSGHNTGYIVAFSFTRGAIEEVARAKRQRGLSISLVKVKDVLEVGELIDSAANDGRVPDTSTVAPDLMGLFADLQEKAEKAKGQTRRRNRKTPPRQLQIDENKPSRRR